VAHVIHNLIYLFLYILIYHIVFLPCQWKKKNPAPVLSYSFLLLLAHECINQMVDWLASAAAAAARPPL
jgi:DMSO/TMAO reductase YedYZ heme-binding membrane subunit